MVGPAMSFDVKYTQPYFAGFHIPQFAPVATDPAFCAMSANFPYLLRMSPCDNIQCQALAAIINYYNWTQFAILMSKDDYGNFNKSARLKSDVNISGKTGSLGFPFPSLPISFQSLPFSIQLSGSPWYVLISKGRH